MNPIDDQDGGRCPHCGGPYAKCYPPGLSYSPQTLVVYPAFVCAACMPDHESLRHRDPIAGGVPFDHPALRPGPDASPWFFRDLLAAYPSVEAELRRVGYLRAPALVA